MGLKEKLEKLMEEEAATENYEDEIPVEEIKEALEGVGVDPGRVIEWMESKGINSIEEAAVRLRRGEGPAARWRLRTRLEVYHRLLKEAGDAVTITTSGKKATRRELEKHGATWVPVVPRERWTAVVFGKSGSGKTLAAELVNVVLGESPAAGISLAPTTTSPWSQLRDVLEGGPTSIIVDDIQRGEGTTVAWLVIELKSGSSGRSFGSKRFGLRREHVERLRRTTTVMTFQTDDDKGKAVEGLPGRVCWRSSAVIPTKRPPGDELWFIELERFRKEVLTAVREAEIPEVKGKNLKSPKKVAESASVELIKRCRKYALGGVKVEKWVTRTAVALETQLNTFGQLSIDPELLWPKEVTRSETARMFCKWITKKAVKDIGFHGEPEWYEQGSLLWLINKFWVLARIPGVSAESALDEAVTETEMFFGHTKPTEWASELL